MDLSSFIKESVGPIHEAVRSRDIEKAIGLISSYLRKRKIYTVPNIFDMTINGKNKLAVYVFNEKAEGGLFVWDLAASAQVEAVMFTKDFNEAFLTSYYPDNATHNYDVYVEAKGANTVQMCKLVEAVLTGKTAMSPEAIRAQIKDAQLFESTIFTEKVVTEAKDPHIAELERKKGNLYQRLRDAKKKGKDTSDLQAQYDQLAAELADARVAIRGNVPVTATTNKEVEEVNDFFEDEERATPEERFDDMKNYIYNVIAGRRPLALLCGAPGVGKTFRVMQAVKGTGKEHNRDYIRRFMIIRTKVNSLSWMTVTRCSRMVTQSIFSRPHLIHLMSAGYHGIFHHQFPCQLNSPKYVMMRYGMKTRIAGSILRSSFMRVVES